MALRREILSSFYAPSLPPKQPLPAASLCSLSLQPLSAASLCTRPRRCAAPLPPRAVQGQRDGGVAIDMTMTTSTRPSTTTYERDGNEETEEASEGCDDDPITVTTAQR
eukprot:5597230-Pyramimonas_sp.AAC.1